MTLANAQLPIVMALLFAFALVVSALTTRGVRDGIHRLIRVDRRDEGRATPGSPIPRLAGIAIIVGVAAMVGMGALVVPELELTRQYGVIALGAVAIFVIGVTDDVIHLPPGVKLFLEVVTACAVYSSGVRIEGITMLHGTVHLPMVIGAPLTVFWIVFVTNAFNLIDGADGVAGGAAFFASASLALVLLLAGDVTGAVIALGIAGALLGFLVYNFPPASIYMGDGGSLFVGYALASLGVVTTHKASTALAVAIPVVSCGLPLLEAMLTVVRRFLRGQPVFEADRGHIHHRLMDLGHSPRIVALLLTMVSAGFAFLSLLLVNPINAPVAALYLVAGVTLWLGVQKLKIPEFIELRRLFSEGVRPREVIARNLRVRDAGLRLGLSRTMGDVTGALSRAFDAGEFDQVELMLPPPFAEAFPEDIRIEPGPDGGVVWLLHPDRPFHGEIACELHMPLVVDGNRIGVLVLVRSGNVPVLTDPQLISTELVPELRSALARLAGPDVSWDDYLRGRIQLVRPRSESKVAPSSQPSVRLTADPASASS